MEQDVLGWQAFLRVQLQKLDEEVGRHWVDLALGQVLAQVVETPGGVGVRGLGDRPEVRDGAVGGLPEHLHLERDEVVFVVSGAEERPTYHKFEQHASQTPQVGPFVVAARCLEQLLRRAVHQGRRLSVEHSLFLHADALRGSLRTGLRSGRGIHGGVAEQPTHLGAVRLDQFDESGRVREVGDGQQLGHAQIGDANLVGIVQQNVGRFLGDS